MANFYPTVINTEELTDDSTYEHNSSHPHGHTPVIANYRTPPLELETRDPTDQEELYWGHGCGLKDISLLGWEKRDKEGYFGVYDGMHFERADHLRIINVQASTFHGAGAVFRGCRDVRLLGGAFNFRERGARTDYHESTLTIGRTASPDPEIDTTGVFDVKVGGPVPTVKTDTSGIKFVSGMWSDAGIRGKEKRFISSEDDFNDGKAPLTDPSEADYAYVHTGGKTILEGYGIDGGRSSDTPFNGVLSKGKKLEITNSSIANFKNGLTCRGAGPVKITDTHVKGRENAIVCEGSIPQGSNIKLSFEQAGINLKSDSASYRGPINCARFNGAEGSVGIKGINDQKVVLNYPNFFSCPSPYETDFDKLEIVKPGGV